MQIAHHSKVSIDYTLTDSSDRVIDTSEGRGPLSFVIGEGQIIPGLEEELLGKSKGDSFKATIPCEKGYGEREDALVTKLEKSMFQEVDQIEVGMQFQAETPAGARILTVVGLEDDGVVVDANHPLAGVDLTFQVDVVEVRPATEDEIKDQP